jgi:hypothetical protein
MDTIKLAQSLQRWLQVGRENATGVDTTRGEGQPLKGGDEAGEEIMPRGRGVAQHERPSPESGAPVPSPSQEMAYGRSRANDPE